jgi:low molecular weight protein-tyrosine phosphatase
MAEGLLRRLFAQAGVGASVGSAGLLPGGVPATPDAVATMADRRVDIAQHVSQTVTDEMARETPLILAMTRHHVRELCAGYDAPMDRTFTLKELVRRGDELGGRVHGESVYAWLARLNAGRRTADLMGDDPADDIADPVGQPRAVYENTADELEDQLRRFAQLLVGGPPRSAAYSDGARVQRPGADRRDERDEYAGDPRIPY